MVISGNGLIAGDTTNATTVVLVAGADIRVDVTTAQVQNIAEVTIGRGRRPIGAVRSTIVRRTIAEDAGIDKVIWIFTPAQ